MGRCFENFKIFFSVITCMFLGGMVAWGIISMVYDLIGLKDGNGHCG